MYRGMKSPECTICHTPLEHTPSGWRCPVDGFFYNVTRGKVGPPLLGPTVVGPPAKVEEEYDQTIHDAFMRHIQAAGWTKEMYDNLSEHGKQLLFERFKAQAGFVPSS